MGNGYLFLFYFIGYPFCTLFFYLFYFIFSAYYGFLFFFRHQSSSVVPNTSCHGPCNTLMAILIFRFSNEKGLLDGSKMVPQCLLVMNCLLILKVFCLIWNYHRLLIPIAINRIWSKRRPLINSQPSHGPHNLKKSKKYRDRMAKAMYANTMQVIKNLQYFASLTTTN